MNWLRPLFVAHLVPAFFSIPVVLMMLQPGPWQGPLLLGWLFYWIASIWLAIRGKKNCLTTGIVVAMALVILTTCVNFNHETNELSEENCLYTKTRCAKLDGQAGLFHCGATTDSPTAGGIMVTHVQEKCLPTKEQSCSYAKQFCRLISTKDSIKTHYACSDRDTITCP
jgi:hypothetical protein